MTEVAFHFNAVDTVAYVCRLLRKASGQGARVAVVGGEPMLLRLDDVLWAFSDTEFVPHCFADAEPLVRDATPVWLCGDTSVVPHHEVLVNLGAAVPAGFERFDRLIEVVGEDAGDRSRSRQRWKHYQSRGYPVVAHDVGPSKELH